MALFTDAERKCADALVALGYCNPFLPERITYEREILGKAFVGAEDVWYKDVRDEESRPNLELLTQRAKALADQGRTRMIAAKASGDEEISLYADTVLYYFFNTFSEAFLQYADDAEQGNTSQTTIALTQEHADDIDCLVGVDIDNACSPQRFDFTFAKQVRNAITVHSKTFRPELLEYRTRSVDRHSSILLTIQISDYDYCVPDFAVRWA